MPPPDSELGRWFATQVQPHEAMLKGLLRSRFRDEVDVDDIVQESYCRLFRAKELSEVVSPKAFLFAVARNLAMDRHRRRSVAAVEPLLEFEYLNQWEDGPDVREDVARSEELEYLTQAIQSLPYRCRQVFTLRKVYGLSQAEIARKLGISEHTVSAQLTIGVGKCMEYMSRVRREREGRW